MARELADVLHYLIPDRAARRATGPEPARAPLVALAAEPDDPLRAAFAWNLSVEITRLGTRASLLTRPDHPFDGSAPGPGPGPVGTEIVLAEAADLLSLDRTARKLATTRAASGGGFVLVRVPLGWTSEEAGARIFSWTLLFATPAEDDRRRAVEAACRLLGAAPDARVGLTIHGVGDLEAAEQTFLAVAEQVEAESGRPLLSYGVLLDDLQVYRTFVEGRPVGLRHPQSRAAAAVADVSRLLLADAADG